jgi:hypothetical protein
VCLVNRKEAENKEEIRAARSPRGFSNLDFKNEGSKSAQSHLINEIETDSIDLSRLDQTFLKKLFWDSGVRHMSDCSVFLDQAGELVNVIDFALQEYELEHEPL